METVIGKICLNHQRIRGLVVKANYRMTVEIITPGKLDELSTTNGLNDEGRPSGKSTMPEILENFFINPSRTVMLIWFMQGLRRMWLQTIYYIMNFFKIFLFLLRLSEPWQTVR